MTIFTVNMNYIFFSSFPPIKLNFRPEPSASNHLNNLITAPFDGNSRQTKTHCLHVAVKPTFAPNRFHQFSHTPPTTYYVRRKNFAPSRSPTTNCRVIKRGPNFPLKYCCFSPLQLQRRVPKARPTVLMMGV